MQRRAIAYRPHHGVDKRRVVGPAAARLHEHDSRLADDGAVPREADANRDLIVIVRRAPAGRDPCRDALDAGDRRLRLGELRLRPEREREDPDQGEAAARETSRHSASPLESMMRSDEVVIARSHRAGATTRPTFPWIASLRSQ
jgi:hypothetical protein